MGNNLKITALKFNQIVPGMDVYVWDYSLKSKISSAVPAKVFAKDVATQQIGIEFKGYGNGKYFVGCEYLSREQQPVQPYPPILIIDMEGGYIDRLYTNDRELKVILIDRNAPLIKLAGESPEHNANRAVRGVQSLHNITDNLSSLFEHDPDPLVRKDMDNLLSTLKSNAM